MADQVAHVAQVPRVLSGTVAELHSDADVEAFRDHWGGVDESEAAFERFFSGPEFQPELWRVAWDGNEVAGVVMLGWAAAGPVVGGGPWIRSIMAMPSANRCARTWSSTRRAR